MKRKSFKVMTRLNPYEVGYFLDNATLTEVLGYFKNIETESVFVYHSVEDHRWYVVDILTGLSAAHGKTMYIAEERFITDIKKYREQKNAESYHKAILKYQELLKESKGVN